MKKAPDQLQNDPNINKITTEKSSDDALESFLGREQEPVRGDQPPVKKKLSRGSVALIAVIILAAALIIAVVAVVNQPVKPAADTPLPEKPVEMATVIDENGGHHVEITTDAEGEIVQNGYGELLSYVPAQITSIEVENDGGSFVVNAKTVDGHTVYSVTGYEQYELRKGMADAVANDAASLSFSTVAAVGGTLADFGLEKPRATVRVMYNDNTTAVICVGSDADGGVGTYVSLGGDNNVYLVAKTAIDSFLPFHFADGHTADIDLMHSVEKTLYYETQQFQCGVKSFMRKTWVMMPEGNDISGSIRDLYAESVVCVNPNSNQLKTYGVEKPYAKVHAVYPDMEITLSCSAPTDNGLVNLYHPEKGIIYGIRIDALGWANTDFDLLLPKTVIELNTEVIAQVVVTAGGKSYTVALTHSKDTVINENGDQEEAAVITAKMDGQSLSEESVLVFLQNFNCMKNLGRMEKTGDQIIYQWKVSYTNGRADDTFAIYDVGEKSCPVTMNGVMIGSVSKSHAQALQQDVLDLANRQIPKSL